MKKTYMTPVLQVTKIECITLISQSLQKFAGDGGEQLVKEDVSKSSSPSYNVWDDDWSKN